MPVVLAALEVPGNFLFLEYSYGLLALTLMIQNGDMAPKIVAVCALVLGVSTIAVSPFLEDQAIVLFKLI